VRLAVRRDVELRSAFAPSGGGGDGGDGGDGGHGRGLALSNWDVVEDLWGHAFSDQCLNVDPTDTPCVVTVPTDASKTVIAKYLEIMFERFQVPATFMLRKAVACAFASGKTTALVLDSGATGTVAATVYDGFVLKRTVVRSPLGGNVLDYQVLQAVEAALDGSPVRPRFQFVKKRDATGALKAVPVEAAVGGGGSSSSGSASGSVHASVLAAAKRRIARDIKEEHFCVPHTAYNATLAGAIPTAVYELPDGTPVSLGTCRYSIPELLMNPGPLEDAMMTSVPDVVLECLQKTPVDVRRAAAAQLLLTGGNTCIDGFQQRLNLELTSKLASKLIKVRQHIPTPIERRSAGFMGASVLGSLGSFQQLWISKKMYETRGAEALAYHFT
jgi:actin-like protein 6A